MRACVTEYARTAAGCLTDHRKVLRDTFDAAAEDGSYTDAQLDAIDELRHEATDWARAQRQQSWDPGSESRSEIRDAQQEAEDRVCERYGDDLSFAVPSIGCRAPARVTTALSAAVP